MAHILNTSYVSLLLILSFFFTILHHTCIAADDTISINKPITGTRKISSNSTNFVLGFFTPDTNKHYIAIWYNTNKISPLTTVWEANRDSPITHPTASHLKISETDGNLVLLDESKSALWSTNEKIPPNMSTVAVLLDTGNLQLRSESNFSTILWQSFDHPTNTWLPGAKFGYNKKTNKSQQLTSWKNTANPAPGIFSLEADPKGSSQYYLLWNNSKNYWQSGLWSHAERKFANVTDMEAKHSRYKYDYVNTKEEGYFIFSPIDSSLISRLVLEVSGQQRLLAWVESSKEWTLFWTQPKYSCQIYALCGANGICNEDTATICHCPEGFSEKHPHDWAMDDHSGGCVRNTPLQLNSEFRVMLNMRLPDNPQNSTVKSGEACKMVCADISSCTAYSFGNSGCSVWHGDLINLQEQYNGIDAATLYLRVAALKWTKSKNVLLWWVVVSVLAAVFLTVIVFLTWRRCRRVATGSRKVVLGTLVRFKYYELQQAMKNFSDKLGGGGFGMVYKGALPDSTVIAVKKLEGIQQGEKQFRTEVSTIGTLQHVNLVRLLGFCSEGSKRLLVYEYMPLGSLASCLFQKSSAVLDWETRYTIAIGIARGLLYLHEECRQSIIHCDIKPENILLDENFVPKVADFGLAKLLGREFSRVLTTLRGTRGYLAPEWISGIPITTKADVYSYGMMLFEIISGRRNFEHVGDGSSSFYFPIFAATKLVGGDVSCILDSRLEGEANIDTIEKACKVALWCIQDDEKARPTIGQVLQVLEGFLEINMPPIPMSL